MMKNKRGQLFAEPFMWILALLVAALVLAFGFVAISKLQETFAQTTVIDFKNDFERSVNEVYYLDAGSSKILKVDLPDRIRRACFYTGHGNINRQLVSQIEASVIEQSKNKNMFLLPYDAYKFEWSYKIKDIKTSSFICFDNKKELKLVAQGNYVEIARPS